MSERYKTSKCCYLIDHHMPPSPACALDALSLEEHRRFFAAARADSVMVYCKDHWGHCYYPSAVAGAALKGGVAPDWMAGLRALAAEMGLEFVAYYCIEYDEGAARRRADWRVRRADGAARRREDEFARWSLCCYETGYRAYCLDQLEEIVRLYHPDALFLDIFGASLCYCPSCRALYEARCGRPLPEGAAELAERQSEVLDFLDWRAERFLEEVKARVKAVDPGLALTINFASHYPRRIRDALDYQFSEPLLQDNWFSAAYARDTAQGQYPIVAPGEASNVYNYKPAAAYVAELSAIAAQGCRVGMYSGSMHADGSLELREAELLGAAYAEIRRFAELLEGREHLASVVIVQSEASAEACLKGFEADAILRAKKKNPHLLAILGALRLCERLKLPARVVPDSRLADFDLSETRLIILPELRRPAAALTERLRRFVDAGGLLIADGGLGLGAERAAAEDCAALFGMEAPRAAEGFAQNGWRAFLRAAEPGAASDEGGAADGAAEGAANGAVEGPASARPRSPLSYTTPPVRRPYRCRAAGAEVLADFLPPAVAVDETHWCNWWSPPPAAGPSAAPGGDPAILFKKAGRGACAYLAFDFFAMEAGGAYHNLAGLLDSLLRRAACRFPLRLLGEQSALQRCAFFRRDGGLYLHFLSDIPLRFDGAAAALRPGLLLLDASLRVGGARVVYPEARALVVEERGADAGGGQSLELPEYELQMIVRLDLL